MKITFLFTVDVETRSDGEPKRDILGLLPEHAGRYGIEKIMDILESAHARGTFFVNAYEVAKHGDEIIADAARLIHSRGHDLELHTHPRPMYQFYGMSHAAVEDQVAILTKGIALLEKWCGKHIIAHRAGAFAANTDTLRACEQAGLLADSSLSPGSRVSVPLIADLDASNVVRRVGRLWEIPVTYYYQMRLGRWHSKRILDIEACSLAEIKCVVNWALKHGVPTVCMLMHSFSLSRNGRPNLHVIRRLLALLAWLREQDELEIGTVEQLCHRLSGDTLPEPVPPASTAGFWLTWNRALGGWNDGWRNRVVAVTGIIGAIGLLLILVYFGYALLK